MREILKQLPNKIFIAQVVAEHFWSCRYPKLADLILMFLWYESFNMMNKKVF